MPVTPPRGGAIGRRIHLLLLEDEADNTATDVLLSKMNKLLQTPSPSKSVMDLIKKTSLGIVRRRKRRKGRLKNIKNLFLQLLVKVDDNGNIINL